MRTRTPRPRVAPLAAAALALALLAAPRPAAASDYGRDLTFGIGGFLGEPIGFSIKWLIADGHALQALAGFDLVWRDRFATFVDWVWHPTIIVSPSAFDLSWHVGAGGVFEIWYDDHYRYDCWDRDPGPGRDWFCDDDTAVRIGAHFPVGLDMLFKAVPVELYLEFSPGFSFYPWVDFIGHGGFGARYFF